MINKIKSILSSKLKEVIACDTYGLQLLRPILDKFKHPVLFSSSALRPITLSLIMNQMIINQRKVIVETGSGVGTLIIAQILKTFEHPAKFYSIEEDLEWISIVKNMLEKEDLLHYVQFIHAPVDPLSKNKWYDTEAVEQALSVDTKIDFLIIDGPKAYLPGFELARKGAFDILSKYLADDYCIVLDDVNRKGELHLMKLFEKELSINFEIKFKSSAIATKGAGYNADLLKIGY